jgi:hypothetical protein
MANAAPKKPDPLKYQTQRAIVLRAADADVVKILRELQADVQKMLREVATRPTGIGRDIREAQLRLVQRNLHAELGKTWRRIGDVTAARRAEAAARAAEYNKDVNTFRLVTGGLADGAEVAQTIYESEVANAVSGLDRMIARTSGASYVALKDRVYNSDVGIGSKVDRLVNSAIARGLSAVEFAKEVRGFINPLTPGGVRYAAMRLARTEINNAAHAMSVEAVRETPWVDSMEWKLSGSHGRPDVCNQYARGGPEGDGRYPKGSVPSKPHPQCLCYVIPVTDDDDEFERKLLSGQYNRYLDKYRNLQPGQVVSTSYGGFPGPAPKPAPVKPTKVAQPAKPTAKPPSQAKPPTPGAAPPARTSAAPTGSLSPALTQEAENLARRNIATGGSMAKTRNLVAKNFNISKEEAEALVRRVAAANPGTAAARQAALTSVPKPAVARVTPAPTPKPPARIPSSLPDTNVLPDEPVSPEMQRKIADLTRKWGGDEALAVRRELQHQANLSGRVMHHLDELKFEVDLQSSGKIVNGVYTQPYDPFGANPGRRRIVSLSDRVFKPGYGDEQLRSELSGFKTSCGSSHTGGQSVLAHEYGHHVDYMVREFAIRGELDELWDTVGDALGVTAPGSTDLALKTWFRDNTDLITRQISGYASKNRTEFLAEVWREYTGNPSARPQIKKIGKKLQELAERLVT